MTFHPTPSRALPWLVPAGLIAALAIAAGAAAKPIPAPSTAASYSGSQQVQIGGQLVSPSQLSAWQASAGRESGLVQIGGRLVTPSQLSAWQARAHQAPMPASQLVQIGGLLATPSQVSAVQSRFGTSTEVAATSSSDGFDWSALGAGIGAFVLLAAASVYALRMRHGVTTA